jgi:predicted acetyltransferase
MTQEFQHLDPGELIDRDLELVLVKKSPACSATAHSPCYGFEMRPHPGGEAMGSLRFRVGDTDTVLHYPCHIGFDVKPEFRGQHYAARSVKLLLPFARTHGLTALWIGCVPENAASRRSCELAGAELQEIVDIPEEHGMYEMGMHRTCRYRIDLTTES